MPSPEDISVCTDSYGNIHRLTGEISRGGQGVVFKTLVPNFVVKFELKDEKFVPPDENEKFMTLRFFLDYESRTLKSFYYTPGLAAPEIAFFADELTQGTPEEECNGSGNSFGSDVFTFAVCLFYQLAGLHPFKGGKYYSIVDSDDSYDNADEYLYKGMLAYIAYSEDDSNKNEFLRLDVILTPELKALFQQTFSQESRDNYISRPSMSEFAFELARANDIAIHCTSCGMDLY